MKNRHITSILLSVSVFSVACNTAPPPRAAGDSAITTPVRREEPPVPMPDEQEVASALSVPIEKLDGTTFRLADYRGKILVVDFWATNCGACVKMMPHLVRLSKQYRDRGVEFVGLTSDERSDERLVVDFLKRVGAEYTVGYGTRWVSSAFLKGTEDATGAPPIPQLFVLSREGRVIEHLIGDQPQRGIPYLEQIIANNLNGTSK